jgi:hypothetical protein
MNARIPIKRVTQAKEKLELRKERVGHIEKG